MKERILSILLVIIFLLTPAMAAAYTSTDVVNEALCRYKKSTTKWGDQCKVFVQTVFDAVAKPDDSLGSAYCSSFLAIGKEVSLTKAQPGDLIQTNRTEPFEACDTKDNQTHVGLMHTSIVLENTGENLYVIDSNWCLNDCELMKKRTWDISAYLSEDGYDSDKTDEGNGVLPPLFIHFYHPDDEEVDHPKNGPIVKPSEENPKTCRLDSVSSTCTSYKLDPCNYLVDFFQAGDTVRSSVLIDKVTTNIKIRTEAYREDDSAGTEHAMTLDWYWETDDWVSPISSQYTHTFTFENLRLHDGLKKEDTVEEWTKWKFKVYIKKQGDLGYPSNPTAIFSYRVKRSPALPGYKVNSPTIYYPNPTICNQEPTPDDKWFYRCTGHETTAFNKGDQIHLSARVDAIQVEHRVRYDTYIDSQYQPLLSGFTNLVNPLAITPGYDFWDHAFHRFSFTADKAGNYKVYMAVDRKGAGDSWLYQNTQVTSTNAELVAEFSVTDGGVGGGCIQEFNDCPDGQYCDDDGSCKNIDDCTPSCSNKSCGSDGCGGSCGVCSSGYTCISGSCQNVGTETECTSGECCAPNGQFVGAGVPCGYPEEEYYKTGTCGGQIWRTQTQCYCDGIQEVCPAYPSACEQIENVRHHTCESYQKPDVSGVPACRVDSSCGTWSCSPTKHPDGTMLKSFWDDEVYYLEDGVLHWMQDDPELYPYFQLGLLVEVTYEELNGYDFGSDYTYFNKYSKLFANIYKCPSGSSTCKGGTYYLLHNGFYTSIMVYQEIPSGALAAYKQSWNRSSIEVSDFFTNSAKGSGYAPLHPGTLLYKDFYYYWYDDDKNIRLFDMTEAEVKQMGYEPQNNDHVIIPSDVSLLNLGGTVSSDLELSNFGCEAWIDWHDGYGDGGATPDGGSPGSYCYTGGPGTDGVGKCHGGEVYYNDSGDFSCNGEVVPSPESCANDIDDDCDGKTDQADTNDCPATSTPDADGDGSNKNNDCNDSDPNVYPGASEACDGKDNDCDGQIDEGFAKYSPCDGPDADFCHNGTMLCDGSGGVYCNEADHHSETCNGQDDDCDGQIDEGYGEICCGTGQCRVCKNACQNGQPQICVPSQASAEICNGLDDDCDGATDEGFNLGAVCDSNDSDSCAYGTIACSNGQAVCTNDNPSNISETCNGLDDDCDGQTDEEAADSSCNDWVNCTVDFCEEGSCTHLPDDTKCPEDNNACTLAACLTTGCGFVANTGKPCNDGDSCTQNDKCTSESVCAGTPIDGCGCQPSCVGKVCGQPDGCGGLCNGACDDGNPCTKDICFSNQGCQHFIDPDACNDGKPCTIDTCDPGSGCKHVFDKNVCHDGDPCTKDACGASSCIFTPKPGCEPMPKCKSGFGFPETGKCACDIDADCGKK